MKKKKIWTCIVMLCLVSVLLFPIQTYAQESGTKLTVTVPEKPKETMTVPEGIKTLAEVSLPEGWRWKDSTLEIQPGTYIKGVAVHEDGYEMEVQVTGTLVILKDGTDTEYTIGTDSSASIHCNGVRDALKSVEMDGKEVDKGNYTTKDGSTLITFKKTYLDQLSVGTHTVTLNYETGSADSTLTVKKASSTPTPTVTPTKSATSGTGTSGTTTTGAKTGDETAVGWFAGLLALSAFVLTAVFILRSKHTAGKTLW